MKKKLSAFLAAVMLFTSVNAVNITYADENKLLAFPGAEGGGMYTQGARAAENFEIYHVTNLNDRGEGSFRDALSKGNRFIVFDVSGNIFLDSDITVKNLENVTILGQTAPGNGICIAGCTVKFESCSNIILRYLRFRMGEPAANDTEGDALSGRNGRDIIIDHCSISWSGDECFSYYGAENFTAQWNIISEPLVRSTVHSDGAHGYGGIWGGKNASFHHNLIASADSRTPRIGTTATLGHNNMPDNEAVIDVRNNVVYNWGTNSAYGGENGVRVNFVNNYFKPTENAKEKHFYELYAGTVTTVPDAKMQSTTLHVSGNVMEGNENMSADNWRGVSSDRLSTGDYWIKREQIGDAGKVMHRGVVADIAVPDETGKNDQFVYDYPVATQTAEEAYSSVLDNAGASFRRDPIDERVVNEVKTGTFNNGSQGSQGFIDDPEDVGGWFEIEPSEKQQDSDNDGIPDAWEQKSGLDPKNPLDSMSFAQSGYTWLEEYANSILTDEAIDYNSIDRTELIKLVNDAKALVERYYLPEGYSKVMEERENAVKVLNQGRTQEEIDAEVQVFSQAFEGLVKNYGTVLQEYVEEVESTDTLGYTHDTKTKFTEALNTAKTHLDGEYSNEQLMEDHNALKESFEALDKGMLPELKAAIDRETIKNDDFSRTYESYTRYEQALEKAKADYEYGVDESVCQEDINALHEANVGLKRSAKPNFKNLIDNGLKADTELFDGSYKELIDRMTNAYSLYAKETSEEDVMNAIRDISSYAKNFRNNISEKPGVNVIYKQDFEGDNIPGTGFTITEKDGNKFARLGETTDYEFEHSFEGGKYYFSTDFMWDDNSYGLLIPQNFKFTDEENEYCIMLGFEKDTDPKETVILCQYAAKKIMGNYIQREYFTGDNIDLEGGNNVTTIYDSYTHTFDVYLNNILWVCADLDNTELSNAHMVGYGNYQSEAIRYHNSDNGVYIDNDIVYFKEEMPPTETTTEPTTESTTTLGTVYGDASADGKLEADDAAMILQKVLKSTYKLPIEENYSGMIEEYLDVDFDGQLTAADAAAVLQKVLKSTFKMEIEGYMGSITFKFYRIKDGILRYFIDNKAIHGLIGSTKEVVIPESIDGLTVESIDRAAFRNDNITSVTLPDTVTMIDVRAFMDCDELTSVTLDKNVNEICGLSFSNCTALKEITLPASVKILGESAFANCTSLEKVVFEGDVEEFLDEKIFENCPNLTIYCPEGSNAESYAMRNGIKYVITE